MKGRKQLGAGCLVFLFLIVVVFGLLILRELRQERLSAQLLAAVRRVKILSEKEYSAEEHKKAQRREIASEEAQVVRLLQEGADPNVRDFVQVKLTFWAKAKLLLKRMLKRQPTSGGLSRPALAIAVENDNTLIATALLKAGANDVNEVIPSVDDGDHRFPLVNYAARAGNLEIVKELCAHGADIHKVSRTDDADETILYSTLEGISTYSRPASQEDNASKVLERRDRTELFHFLQAKGVKYEANSEDGYALLLAASEGDFLDLTRELLAAGVPPNAHSSWLNYRGEDTPLDYAVTNDDIDLAELILKYGASTGNSTSDSTFSTLETPMLSVKSVEMAGLLLKHGADIHALETRGKRQGYTALALACIHGDAKLVSFFIEHGLDVNAQSAITDAAVYGNVEMVRTLLKHGARVGPISVGEDALYYAISAQNFDSARLILQYGAAVNPKPLPASSGTQYLQYPLTAAAEQDNAAMALELLKRGANVNAGKGEALISACEACDEDLVEMLLEYGADPNVCASDGTTAIQTAKQSADPPSDADGIIALLKDYGAE